MDPLRSSRRGPALKLLGVFLLSVALVTITSVLWIQSKAATRWAALGERLQALEAAESAEAASRTVLQGDPVPGNAWDDYLLCIAELRKLKWRSLSSLSMTEPRSKGLAELEKMLAARPEIITSLRRGARRQEARMPAKQFEYYGGTVCGADAAIGDVRWLVWCEAQRLSEAAQPADAAELLVDLASAGVLVERAPKSARHRSTGTRMIQVALEGLRGLSDKLTAEDWGKLLPALERLEAVLPGAESQLRAGLQWRWAELRQAVEGGGLSYRVSECVVEPIRPWHTWRYGFSLRPMAAQAFDEEHPRSSTLIAGTDGRAFSEILLQSVEIQRWAESSSNLVLRDAAPHLRYFVTESRGLLARLRLLRMAGRYRVSGRIEPLEDPFGTQLRGESRMGRLVLWSVGGDGRDDGGVGDWKDENRDQDLVLDLSANP